MEIDLQQFCGDDPSREYLHKPFSRDGFTYATNGHIMVRVTLRPDVPDVDKKFNQNKPLEGVETATFFRPAFDLPPAPTETGPCKTCDGRGWDHDCPDCQCVCQVCKGQGDANPELIISTTLGRQNFALNYVRQVLSLPNVEIAALPAKDKGHTLLFRFDGGVGALMPIRGEKPDHIDIKFASASAEAVSA